MFFYLGLAQVLLVFLPAVQCTIDIDDYFNVKTGNEDVGGCDQTYTTAGVSKSGHEWLQTWFVEAQSLTDAALSAINSYGTEQSSRDNLLVFMGVKPDKAGKAPAIQNRLDEIKANFQTTQQWFATAPGTKGWLFCSGGWLVEKKRPDDAELESGSETSSNPGDKPVAKLSIEKTYPDELVDPDANPYWAPDIKEYIFGLPEVATDYCLPKYDHFAATRDQAGSPPGTITICMKRVISTGGKGVSTLGAKIPTPRTSLKTVMSKGVTLYHELFHWIFTNAETPDLYSDLKGVIAAAAVDAEDEDENGQTPWLPENLSTYAEGQWFTSNHAIVWGPGGSAKKPPT